jgi:hypothetical protein
MYMKRMTTADTGDQGSICLRMVRVVGGTAARRRLQIKAARSRNVSRVSEVPRLVPRDLGSGIWLITGSYTVV